MFSAAHHQTSRLTAALNWSLRLEIVQCREPCLSSVFQKASWQSYVANSIIFWTGAGYSTQWQDMLCQWYSR